MSVLKYKDPQTGEWKQAGAVKVIGISDAVVEPLEVAENGTYTPPDGVTGFAPVVVDVQTKIQPLTITENGTYTAKDGVDGYSPIAVEVVASGGGADVLDSLINRSITEVNSSATSIGDYVFDYCSKLKSANFPNATSVGQYAFGYCSSLTSVNAPNTISIGNRAFESCYNLESVNAPNITSIGNYAFNSCQKLKSSDFPNATSIGESAFYCCYEIQIADFSHATSVGNRAFYKCTELKSVNIPNAPSIGQEMFYNCYKLTRADISNATSIGATAFSNCYSLVTVILRSETVCTATSTLFGKCHHILGTTHSTYNPNANKDGYIYVPLALVDTYKAATNWSTHASQIMPYVATLAELATIDATTYNKAYVGETEKEYTNNGTAWEEYTR